MPTPVQMSGLPMKLLKTEPVAEFERMLFQGLLSGVMDIVGKRQRLAIAAGLHFSVAQAPRSPLADPRGARPNPW
eukprot:11231738-Alexandrium_andersonii.AAC.1